MKDELSKPIFTLPNPEGNIQDKDHFTNMKMLGEQALIFKLLLAVHDLVVIFNQERQIVYANPVFLNWLKLDHIDQVCGLKLGEAVQCVHIQDLENDCGVMEHCKNCGALQAILRSKNGQHDIQIFDLIDKQGNSHKFEITTMPIQVEGQQFILFSAVPLDITMPMLKSCSRIQLLVKEMEDISKQLLEISGEQAKPLVEKIEGITKEINRLIGE